MSQRAGLAEAARLVAEQVLAPRAQETDRAARVPQSNLEALASAGLFGIACASGVPAAEGSAAGVSAARGGAMRQVQEALAGACGATYFVWAQHHSPVRRLRASPNSGLRNRWLDRLCAGEALAGVAFAYMRRPGPPPVRAERQPGGWQVDGVAPFVTSWGLADVFVVAGVSGATVDSDQAGPDVVWFCLEGRATEAVRPSPPMALSVLGSTCTVVLRLEGLFVPDEDVVSVEPFAAWKARDRLATPQPSAAAFGVATRCASLLGSLAAEREGTESGPLSRAAGSLTDELASCRAHAYGLADALAADALAGGEEALPVDTAMPGPGAATAATDHLEGHLAAMIEARAWGLDLAQRSAIALIAATGGRAMALDHPAQRLAREAAFYAIQAQTGPIRAATLARLTRSA
ncbi:MAG: acyl-CoA dehydrogenase family protein [Acidimicrobiales bacterium]